MSGSENSTEENANTTDGNVCNAEEGVTTTHDSTGANEDGLGPLVLLRGKDYQAIVSTEEQCESIHKTYNHQR